ncbi:MAG: DUF3097 domain-containing protein [Pseudonocardiales bacterium]|nr:DUF3097 domain-containing protein [Pseudonocardiales bacterium]
MSVIRAHDYGDVFAADGRRRPSAAHLPEVPAELGLVVEDAAAEFCGAVVEVEANRVTLEDRHGRRRVFPMRPAGFLLDGRLTTLVKPASAIGKAAGRSASGSIRLGNVAARTARQSRIWVEGLHDAELVERVWGHDLRVVGVVVEPLSGIDELAAAVAEFDPGDRRRLGVLVDHLVPGSKESRIAAAVAGSHVLVTGHPFVDVWQAVRPAVVGIRRWPEIPRGTEWKQGVCDALGWGEPSDGARRVLGSVRGYQDLESELIGAVERLIDFVTIDD